MKLPSRTFHSTRSGAAVAVLIVGIVLSSIAALFAYRAYDANEARRFSESSNEVRDAIEIRARTFESTLLQMAGLYVFAPNLSVEQFHDYAGYAGLPRNDRGVYTFGLLKRVGGGSDIGKIVIQVNEVNGDVPYVTAKPGTDLSTDPVRMDVIRKATNEGRPRLSGLITGLKNITGPGYMLVAPAYRGGAIPADPENRIESLVGVAYIRFSQGGLFDIFQSTSSQRSSLDMEVFVGTLGDQSYAQDRLKFDRYREASFDGRRKSEFEITVGGTPFTVRLFALPDLDRPFGEIFAVLIFLIGTAMSVLGFRAIRKRDARDQRLLQSERHLKLVTDALPAMIGHIDSSLNFRLSNKAYEKFFGLRKSEVIGQSLRQVVGDANFGIMQPLIQRALRGEEVTTDATLKKPDGSSHEFQVSLLPDINATGTIKGVITMWSDITERLKSEERAKFLGEFSTALAASLDPKETAAKVAKLLVPRLAQWCSVDLFQPDGTLARVADSGEAPQANGSGALAAQAAKSGAIHRESSDSKFSVISIPLRSAEAILGAITLGATKHSHEFNKDEVIFAVEAALRASLAIQNARLYYDSQELNRAKDNFLAMLSHELRTPMNVILGWLEILTTEEVDKETYDQALETLNRNARVQIQLINELLDVSRIINGKLTVHPKFCDVGELVDGAVASVRPAAQAKHIQCSIAKEGDLETLADPERIQQILWNLLSNAIKFTPSGGKIDISVKGTATDLSLSVQDSGAGIEQSFLPFVFDRFRQEESTFAKQAGGLGLGLSIVRYLAEAHGGSISVHSEGKGKGAKFTLVLPRSGVTPQLESPQL